MRRIRTLAMAAAAAIGFHTAPLAGHEGTPGNATGAVTSVAIVPATGRAEVVIAIAGSVTVTDFTLTGPDRIVVDFGNARLNAAPRNYDKVDRGGIRNVRVAQYAEATVRVVLDMDRRREYTLAREANGVRLSIAGEPAVFASWGTLPAPASTTSTPAGASTTAVAPASQNAANLTVATAPAPAASASRAPSRAPATRTAPSTTTVPDRTTVLVPVARSSAAQLSQQQRVTVTFFDADIREVIGNFAAYSGRTIIPSSSVQGRITAEITDQPWDIALRAILESQGLSAVEDPVTGIITIDSYANILDKKSTEPLVTRIVPLNYARATSLAETIRPLLSRECPRPQAAQGGNNAAPAAQMPQSQCPPRGAVIPDESTNTLVINEVVSRIDEIAGYAQDLDVRTPQVQIKAKIIFVNRTDIEDMGVTYDLGSQTQFFNRLVQRRDPSTFEPIDTNGDGVPDAIGGGENFESDVTVVDIGGNALSAVANASQQVANPALSLIFSTAIGKFDLTAFLDALQEVRLADVQAEPSITTLDNRQAEIVVGEQTPIRTINPANAAGGITTSDIEFKETGIILRVTPHVTNNRQILMTLESERSALQPAASDLGFTFTTQRAQNQLLVNDGETAVIGGLTVTQVSISKAGIPILVDLPFIGRLFGQTRHEEEKRDLLILVTPHIVDDGQPLAPPPGITPPPGSDSSDGR
jgi:type IV pilus assembly protein PilQ